MTLETQDLSPKTPRRLVENFVASIAAKFVQRRHVRYGGILPEPSDPEERAEVRRLRRLVHDFREGQMVTVDAQLVEPDDTPISVKPDWVPPEFQLFDLQKDTGRRVLGLGIWHAESDGHVVKHYALPLLGRLDKNGPEK